jgi:ferredoxin-NADP reductase
VSLEAAPIAPPVGPWQDATITAIRDETSRVKTFSMRLAQPVPYLPGQHFVVRLTAPDGYSAQRSYSVASPEADDPTIELTVERLDGGEVSTFLHDEVVVGDTLEIRGPIGAWFVWDGATPALLIGGGSGVVPLMAMLRLARRQPAQSLARLVISTRGPDELIYAGDMHGHDVVVLYTRTAAPDSVRPPGRLTIDDLRPHVRPDATVFICGSAGFAASASQLAIDAGYEAAAIRIERFGPSG